MANTMRLYQHSARCPVALRSFLDCNPSYWCFIPVPYDDIPFQGPDLQPNTADEDHEVAQATGRSVNNDRAVSYLLNRIPLPAAAYVFSYRQRQNQRSFFERFLSYEDQSLPYIPVDLYQLHVITVRKCLSLESFVESPLGFDRA